MFPTILSSQNGCLHVHLALIYLKAGECTPHEKSGQGGKTAAVGQKLKMTDEIGRTGGGRGGGRGEDEGKGGEGMGKGSHKSSSITLCFPPPGSPKAQIYATV